MNKAKRYFSILILLFVFVAAGCSEKNNNFQKELDDFVNLVHQNAGWYFYENEYMVMYYIDIKKAKDYFIDEKCYSLKDFKSKQLKFSSESSSFLVDSKKLEKERKCFNAENGKVVSILMYDSYLIKTDCKTEEEAAAYLYKKIDERMSLIVGTHTDKEKGVSVDISKHDEKYIVTVKNKETSKTYEMSFWNENNIFCAENEISHFITLDNGKFYLEDIDAGDRRKTIGTFQVPALNKEKKSIETKLKNNWYEILSTGRRSVFLDTFVLRYYENSQEKQTETVYRVYEQDGWKRIDFKDTKVQIIDGEYKSLAFMFTTDSLKNDKSLSTEVYAKEEKNMDFLNGCMVKNLTASSALKDKYHTYSPEGMLKVYGKGNKTEFWMKDNVPWVEGKSDDGIGESFQFDVYPSADHRHDGYKIRILNGYVNPLLPHLFKENNRIKTALVETNKGFKETVEFEDAVEFTEMIIPMDKNGPTHVKITIKSVYPGTKYRDTAVSALEVEYKLWEK